MRHVLRFCPLLFSREPHFPTLRAEKPQGGSHSISGLFPFRDSCSRNASCPHPFQMGLKIGSPFSSSSPESLCLWPREGLEKDGGALPEPQGTVWLGGEGLRRREQKITGCSFLESLLCLGFFLPRRKFCDVEFGSFPIPSLTWAFLDIPFNALFCPIISPACSNTENVPCALRPRRPTATTCSSPRFTCPYPITLIFSGILLFF